MYADIFKNRALSNLKARFNLKNLFDFYKKSDKLFYRMFHKGMKTA